MPYKKKHLLDISILLNIVFAFDKQKGKHNVMNNKFPKYIQIIHNKCKETQLSCYNYCNKNKVYNFYSKYNYHIQQKNINMYRLI